MLIVCLVFIPPQKSRIKEECHRAFVQVAHPPPCKSKVECEGVGLRHTNEKGKHEALVKRV